MSGINIGKHSKQNENTIFFILKKNDSDMSRGVIFFLYLISDYIFEKKNKTNALSERSFLFVCLLLDKIFTKKNALNECFKKCLKCFKKCSKS